MSVLAPLFLAALPILGLPVLLHFYRGRQPEAIEWGAMQFLVDAVQEGRRWEKLEELLLMLLRVLALAALVFALARPMAPGSWLGGGERRDVVLVLDNSLSTAALAGEDRDTDATTFDAIQRSAHILIDKLGGDDHVQLLAAAGGGRWLTADAVAATPAGRRRLHEAIDKLRPTTASADLPASLSVAERLSTSEGSTAKRVWLFTDGQRHGLRPDAEAVWNGIASRAEDAGSNLDRPPTAIKIVLCTPKTPPAANLSVASIGAESTTLRPNQSATLKAVIANHGEAESGRQTLRWTLNGEQATSSRVDSIAPGGERTVNARLPIKKQGVHLVECRIDADDAVELDQSAALVLRVADSTPVLIVDGEGADRPDGLTDAQLLAAALGFDPASESRPESQEKQPWRAEFQPEVVAPEDFGQEDLARYAAVVVTDPALLNAEDAQRLTASVASGGGVWLALGPGVDPARFNSLWHDDGEGLCPVAVEDQMSAQSRATAGPPGSDPPGIGLHPPPADHPATRHLANTTGLDIDKARLDDHWRFASETPLGEPPAVLLKSAAGDPIAIERYLGQGRVIVQAAPLGFTWGNLPRFKSFVVMINDWLRYLSAASRDRHNLTPGSPIVVQPPETDRLFEATITNPAGDQMPLARRGGAGQGVFRYTQTDQPGVYRVAFTADGELLEESRFVTARDARESDLTRVTEQEQASIADWSGVSFDVEADPAAPPAGEAVSRQPVWWALLLSLALLMMAELLLATRVANRRLPAAAA